jgi:hypothetical protein
MARFDGYLFSKLHLIGSKSEGPIYILQRWDYSEDPVIKNAMPWQEDDGLHKFLGKKVTIAGTFGQDGIRYEKISDLSPVPEIEKEAYEPHKLEVSLKLEHEVLWVDKMPPQPKPQGMNLTLLVKWPYRSIWHGMCPTSQIYDFFIEKDGEIIWQWSKGQMFIMVFTPVNIPGGNPVEYSVQWSFSSDQIQTEGDYLARAVFIASGQEATKAFQIKFAS